jgi:glycosyltransferase involved in cell wall biosynthesis
LRVGLDATPLLGARTGIGRYVAQLLAALAGRHPGAGADRPLAELRATAFTWRGQADLAGAVPPGVTVAGRRAPARALQALWARAERPRVELLAGRGLDAFHGTNFVLPPLRRAGGVLTVHDLAYLHLPGTVSAASLRYRELVPRSVRRAAVVVTPSQATADAVSEAYGVPADRLAVTPLGVAPEWFAAAPPGKAWLADHGLPSEYLLAVGTLEPRKGLDVLLAAYRRLLAAEPDTPPLVLVGAAGWGAQPDLAALPPDRVVLPGYLADPDLVRVVAGARLLAFPSRYEGFGLPPLEAMAAGVPVVASDLAPVREATAGLARLVPPGDADALAAALATELGTVPDPHHQAAARAHAATQTWQRCADLTVAAYQHAALGSRLGTG